MPVNYFIVYTPVLFLVPPFVVPNNNEEVISLQVTCLLKCSRPEAGCYNLHICSLVLIDGVAVLSS